MLIIRFIFIICFSSSIISTDVLAENSSPEANKQPKQERRKITYEEALSRYIGESKSEQSMPNDEAESKVAKSKATPMPGPTQTSER